MTCRAAKNALIVAIVSCLLYGASARAQENSAIRVCVALDEASVIDDTVVQLGQFAKLSGGPAGLRQRLEQLDMADFKLGLGHVVITREQVRYRLLLAGLAESQFQLAGAKQTVISESDEPATFRKVVSAADRALRGHHPGATLTAAAGASIPLIKLHAGEQLRLEPTVKDHGEGQAQVNVAFVVGGKTRAIVPVRFDIEEIAPTKAVGGDKQGVRTAAFAAPAPDQRPLVIKARDTVKIYANMGGARLEAVGEALQDGRLDESIRVRNTESNRVVHGRVQANGAVLVDY